MSEIDWSKAPEGAMCYMHEWGFFKCEHGEWWVSQGAAWQRTPYSSPENFSWFGNVVWRGKEWNGEGLPPVGTSIEWFSPIYGWIGGRVVGHDGSVTVVVHNDGYIGCHQHAVRPIRTPEQIAAEEREKAVEDMLRLFDGTDSRDTYLMQRLYDAGYRKTEGAK